MRLVVAPKVQGGPMEGPSLVGGWTALCPQHRALDPSLGCQALALCSELTHQ